MLCALFCVGLLSAIPVTGMIQTTPNLVEVSGTVSDANGEAIPKAKVILRHKDGTKEQTTTSDAVGAFRFARV
ncbi:MAG: carboxypeptidase regulatory-like domain-containing protein, partial [Blastocatellia bacterium]|nr:carboxypeptidase regulatory-like domain-containing protein [Blastocatellia bacterium]